jgi:hypothetical protein
VWKEGKECEEYRERKVRKVNYMKNKNGNETDECIRRMEMKVRNTWKE